MAFKNACIEIVFVLEALGFLRIPPGLWVAEGGEKI